jgi:hypothetical protein
MNAWAAIRISPYSVIPELITIETIGEYSILNRLVRDCVSTCLDTLYSDVRWSAAAGVRKGKSELSIGGRTGNIASVELQRHKKNHSAC